MPGQAKLKAGASTAERAIGSCASAAEAENSTVKIAIRP